MARPRRRGDRPTGVTDLLVLDADGVSKAASGDRSVQAWLERARELDADVVVSAVTVAEVVRGVARDAQLNRVLAAADVRPVNEPLARRAGQLLGRAGSDSTIDAFVAATALTLLDGEGPTGRCVLLTSDPHDLAALLSEQAAIRIIAV
ncbi:MAG: type II toxin-antitoxin system VapC family toxin [Gemmatimonadales bacterium]